jgi:hypothetical protein
MTATKFAFCSKKNKFVLYSKGTVTVEARRRTGGGARFGNKELQDKKDKKDKKDDEGDEEIDCKTK